MLLFIYLSLFSMKYTRRKIVQKVLRLCKLVDTCYHYNSFMKTLDHVLNLVRSSTSFKLVQEQFLKTLWENDVVLKHAYS